MMYQKSPPRANCQCSSLQRFVAFAVVGLTLGCAQVLAAPAPRAESHFPALRLGGVVRGEAAVRGLGNQLPEVARAYGRDPDELRAQFREDHSLAADDEGRLHFTDDPLPADAQLLNPTPPPEAASYPLASTFLLHSRPGSKRTIYLDFNGQVISGTAWNANYNGGADIVAPPFDTDGNPSVFGDAELAKIQSIWKRVAEDYSAFDVDVTTELTSEATLTRASSSDDVYGIRVLVSPISYLLGNYGGYAYIGAFDQVGDYYKPALVFPEKLAGGEKYIGEACAHEAGHTLGLSHDGTTTGTTYYAGQGSGDTGWAPIMGNGYYQNLTQWSKGEYAYANNREDDLVVIGSHGLAAIPDDFGDTDATAGYLRAGPTFSVSGFIGLGNDVDVIAFAAGAGPATISAVPAATGPDLDLAVELYNASGVLVGSSNPLDKLGASLGLSLPAGTYFLHVFGVGAGDPATTGHSAYASKGLYTVTGTVVDPAGTVAPVAVANASATTVATGAALVFDGSTSFDQDGSIGAYAWSFGDGTTAVGATASHAFAAAGTYTVVLTVTDNSGLTAQDAVTVQVQAQNVAPVAAITVSSTSGTAPLTVTLNGTGSSDSDGSIASYAWSFGDGTANATGSVVSHTYQTAGTYTARLTVTDNRGATATAAVTIQVASAPLISIRVAALTLTTSVTAAGTAGLATVKVTTSTGTPVGGVTVTGQWSGTLTGTSTGITDANGNVTLDSKRVKKAGTFVFSVTNLTKSGCTYTPSLNLVTSAAISGGTKP